MRYGNQRGQGRGGFLIALLIVGVAIFVGVKYIPVKISAYEFREALREEARYGAVRHDDREVFQRIMEKADELSLPIDKENLKVRRTAREMIISVSYEQPIDFKVMTYVYRFDATEKAPLF